MGRLSKLTDDQWAEIGKRLLEGETARKLAPVFGISEAAIRKKFGAHQKISAQSAQVHSAAEKIAVAKDAYEALTPIQRPAAMDLSDKLRSISASYAATAELGAKTAHRLHALANSEVCKVDDANPLSEESLTAMKGVSLLTKIGNDALVPATNLLAANKEMIAKANNPEEESPGGVLVVPGIMQDPGAWTAMVQGAKP